MFNNLHDIPCSISKLTKEGLVICENNTFGVKTKWLSATCMWANLAGVTMNTDTSCTRNTKYMNIFTIALF